MDSTPVAPTALLVHYIINKKSDEAKALLGGLGGTQLLTAKLHYKEGGLYDDRSISQITPLQLACWTGNLDVVRFLVEEENLPLSEELYSLGTCLHLASYKGHTDVVRYILSLPEGLLLINKALVSWGNETPIRFAARLDHNLATIKLLIENGALIQLRDSTGLRRNALDIAIASGAHKVCEYMLQYITRLGLQEAEIDDIFNTAFRNCIQERDVTVLKLLHEYQYDRLLAAVDMKISGSWTALMSFAKFKNDRALELARILIQHGANVRITSELGITALMYARESGQDELAKLLEEAERNGPQVTASRPMHKEMPTQMQPSDMDVTPIAAAQV